MNWPGQRRGRILAGVYVVAFAAMLVGLVWTLGNQATGGGGAQLIAGFAATEPPVVNHQRRTVRGEPSLRPDHRTARSPYGDMS
jgi:hypothetical protein